MDQFAARQYGCFSVNQLRAAGVDKRAVARRLARGAWIVLAPGVYAVSSSPPSWERKISAAVLSRPRAIVGGRTAAYLHGFPGFAKSRPMIIVPRSGNARSPIAQVMRSAFFKSIGTTRISGFLVTTAAETLLTLAADLDHSRLESIVEDCLLTGRVTVDDFEPIYDRIAGGRVAGSGQLREILSDHSADNLDIDSTYLERLLGRVLADPRIPGSVREHEVAIGGRPSRVDAFIPAWNMHVEADGRRWHAKVRDFDSDRSRDNALAVQGIQVVRLTYSMLKDDPEGCIDTLVRIGAHREAARPAAERAPSA